MKLMPLSMAVRMMRMLSCSIRPAEVKTAQADDGDFLTRATQQTVRHLAFFLDRPGMRHRAGNPRHSCGHSQGR